MDIQGNLFVVSAPSGAGKTSLLKSLIGITENLRTSISHTTRHKRPGEVDGINYHFVSVETFTNMIENNIFLEHARVFGNYYGTCKDWVCQQLAAGIDVILEIDWQGGAQIKQIFPDCISIFILPPSISALLERLQSRGQDHVSIINQRMDGATNELVHLHEYDYLVVNEQFSKALSELQAIIHVARLRVSRQVKINDTLIKMLFDDEV
jgi:guanylate kinase